MLQAGVTADVSRSARNRSGVSRIFTRSIAFGAALLTAGALTVTTAPEAAATTSVEISNVTDWEAALASANSGETVEATFTASMNILGDYELTAGALSLNTHEYLISIQSVTPDTPGFVIGENAALHVTSGATGEANGLLVITGAHGRDGINGLEGMRGEDGSDGADGTLGSPNGQTGENGTDGGAGGNGGNGTNGAVGLVNSGQLIVTGNVVFAVYGGDGGAGGIGGNGGNGGQGGMGGGAYMDDGGNGGNGGNAGDGGNGGNGGNGGVGYIGDGVRILDFMNVVGIGFTGGAGGAGGSGGIAGDYGLGGLPGFGDTSMGSPGSPGLSGEPGATGAPGTDGLDEGSELPLDAEAVLLVDLGPEPQLESGTPNAIYFATCGLPFTEYSAILGQFGIEFPVPEAGYTHTGWAPLADGFTGELGETVATSTIAPCAPGSEIDEFVWFAMYELTPPPPVTPDPEVPTPPTPPVLVDTAA